MEQEKDRASRAATAAAIFALCWTIGVLYLPLFLR